VLRRLRRGIGGGFVALVVVPSGAGHRLAVARARQRADTGEVDAGHIAHGATVEALDLE
jgi:hypothetical protein